MAGLGPRSLGAMPPVPALIGVPPVWAGVPPVATAAEPLLPPLPLTGAPPTCPTEPPEPPDAPSPSTAAGSQWVKPSSRKAEQRAATRPKRTIRRAAYRKSDEPPFRIDHGALS